MLLLSGSTFLKGQTWYQAYVDEDMKTTAKPVNAPALIEPDRTLIPQIAGFPKSFPASPNFKNMRNLTLSDVNGDGIDDIIFATDNKLYAYSYNAQLWVKTLTGTAVYPPSAGDVDGDGFTDIVQVTGGSPSNGRIYVFDRNGNILPGWPVNFSNNWILCAPALADLDGDGKMEIIVNERVSPAGNVHILKHDGSSFSTNWPVALDGIPAVTASVADVDNDASPDIIICSTKSIYVFGLDGQPKTGFPLTTAPAQSYSYQSPIIADLDNDNLPEIVGATHGDLPKYYVIDYTGAPYSGWPQNVPDTYWTYSTPTVVKINGNWQIFMSRPTSSDTLEMLYGWDKDGNMLPNFPIVKSGGLEGYISVADITGDNDFELIFGSNLKDNNGEGFIHAFKTDGSGELPGFPLRPQGFTFMNGVCIGDVNGNGKTNLVALSYSLNFGAEPDSVYINVYEPDVTYDKNKVLWGTYKGSNTRTGYTEDIMNSVKSTVPKSDNITVYPNPAGAFLSVNGIGHDTEVLTVDVCDVSGRIYPVKFLTVSETLTLPLSGLSAGVYFLRINDGRRVHHVRFVKM